MLAEVAGAAAHTSSRRRAARRRAFVCLTALLAAAPASRAHAGAWTREAGGQFYRIGYERWFTSQRYDSAGTLIDYLPSAQTDIKKAQYRSQSLEGYAEYGLTEEWTVTAATSFTTIETEGLFQFGQNSGLTDLWLTLKRRLIAAPAVVSLSGEIKLPTGYDPTKTPALGSGKVDGGVHVAIGASNALGYASASAGYRLRGGEFSDQIPLEAEAGLHAARDVTLRGSLQAMFSSGELTGGARFDPAHADERYVSAGGGIVLHDRPFDVVFDVSHVLSGRNTLAGTRISFSLWARL